MNYSSGRLLTFCALTLAVLLNAPMNASAQQDQVTRATLENGLQVVVVHDALAPVVSTFLNYKAGADQQSLPGLAHATEHMMFRGSNTVSASQLTDSISATGGSFNATTAPEVTIYFFNFPAQYLDVALRLERSRASGLLMSQAGWNLERGAILQEVTRDESSAAYRLGDRIREALVGGTPYANNDLGTLYGFTHQINHSQLIDYYHTWYHPNNAVYVIVGDVDGRQTIAAVKRIFGDLPAAKLPKPEPVVLRRVTPQTFHEASAEAYTEALVAWRLPGYDERDYAAAQILVDILNNPRSTLGGLAASGKALQSRFTFNDYPRAAIGTARVAVPATTKPQTAEKLVRDAISQYASNGVPADLVDAAKRQEAAQSQQYASSIEYKAFQWSEAVAERGLRSPDDELAALERVTPAEVNRVVKVYMKDSASVVGYAVPQNGVPGKPSANAGDGSQSESFNSAAPSRREPLPGFVRKAIRKLRVPAQTLHPVETTLANGLRIIVQPETSARFVTVSGQILNDPKVQEPAGQEGVAELTDGLFPYGTGQYDRAAFAAQTDAIAATVTAGTKFSLQVQPGSFERGMQLLADDELHPRLAPADFAVVKARDLAQSQGAQQAPDHLAEVALANALYPSGDPYRRFATPRSVEALSLTDVKNWYASAYRPDLATIVIVGEVTPAQALSVTSKYFSRWHATGTKPDVFPPEVPPNVPGDDTIAAAGAAQSNVQLVETTGVRRGGPGWPELQIANSYLTGGLLSAKMYRDLREDTGYVYYVLSSLDAGKTRSTFDVTYGSFPKDIIPAQRLAIADLQQMQTQPIPASDLLTAKALLVGSVSLGIASYDGVAAQLLDSATHGFPLDQNVIDARNELRVSAEQLRAAMAQWIRPKDFVRIITGPGPQ